MAKPRLPLKIRDPAPVLAVFLLFALLTAVAYLMVERFQRSQVAEHTRADVKQFQWGLQNGINANLHHSRELAGYVAASPALTMPGFRAYLERMRAHAKGDGMSYVGFVPRVGRAALASFEREARRELGSFDTRGNGADPAHAYPYLYVFPRDARAAAARGLDFSAVPQRWEAMQAARDSGESVATRPHSYLAGPQATSIILLFTPVYDLSLPAESVEERRAALRGFVFSIHDVDTMVEKAMGPDFRRYFDLAIFDGRVSRENLVYDGSGRAHTLFHDPGSSLVHRELLDVGRRDWQLYFFPKKAYLERFENRGALAILAAGLLLSVAAAALTAAWLRSHRARLLAEDQALRFEAVFENHPSAVYLLDRQRRFLNANAQAARELGTTREELVGRTIAAFIAPDKQELAAARFEEVLQGETVSYDSAICTGGQRSELSVIMMPLRRFDQVGAVLVFAQNITDQKLREWELAESRRMLDRVVNNIPQRVFWKDLSLRYLGCNTAFAHDAGLDSPEQIVGKNDFDLAWHANADAYRADDRSILASGIARINYEERQERADGSGSWLRTSKIPLPGMDGKPVALLGLYEDITPRKEMEARLREMAHYDGLTRLSNRAFFYHQLEQAMRKATRHRHLLCLMYLDVDHFKQVNDTNGHDVGDALLVEFADRIRASMRQTDPAARLGGDEFAVLLEEVPERGAAESVAKKMVAVMQAPFHVRGLTLAVSTSVGLAFFEEGMSADELIQRADQAMYRAKRAGRNRYETAPGGPGARP